MTEMRVVCAWCTRVLDEGDGAATRTPISHGICGDCLAAVMERGPEDLASFLDRMEAPVLLVDRGGLVLGGNAAAQRLLGKTMPAIAGMPRGDVVECAHARLPEGCGRTVHCAACTLRGTVSHTHLTGEAQVSVRATIKLLHAGRTAETLITFTTERVGGIVWLRLEDVERPASTG